MYHKLNGLNNRDLFLTVLKAKSLKSSLTWYTLEDREGGAVPGPSPRHVNCHLHVHMTFFLHVCLQMSPFYKDTSNIRLRAQFDLILSYLIEFAMTLFPNKAKFCVPGVRSSTNEFWGDTIQPIDNSCHLKKFKVCLGFIIFIDFSTL